MSRSTYDHLHKYTAVNSRRKTYRCTVPDCPHSISASMLLNRKAACNTCGTDIIVSAEHLRRSNICCISSGCGETFKGNLPLHKQPNAPTPGALGAASLLAKIGLRK